MEEVFYEPELQELIRTNNNLQVLIVDDSKSIRGAIRERLELGGLVAVEAANGEEGLEKITENLPDLVLLDMAMPGVDGVTVLRILRKSFSKIELPVILVTSLESSTDIINALDYGANDYVTKPVDFDVLWARISNQLVQKQAAEFLSNAQSRLETEIRQRTADLSTSNEKLRMELEDKLLAEDKLQFQANYDELTGLPNRSLAKDRLEDTLKKARRKNSNACVAFLDLDNFKYVNDTFGHAAGDELLREAARRIRSCLRESDTVARLGGDEFLLILDSDEVADDMYMEGIRRVGYRIIDCFSEPFDLQGNGVDISASVGFAFFPCDGEDGDNLMRHADTAMYRSKHEGKNTFCFYSQKMTDSAQERFDIESLLRNALDNNELVLKYHPVVDAMSRRIVKAEATLQWKSGEINALTPEKIAFVAEESGLAVQIGEWIIRSSCEQLKSWRRSGMKHIFVTVDVSERQLGSDSFLVKAISDALLENNLTADSLQLEFTEDILMRNAPIHCEVLRSLNDIGIKFLVGGFGSGHSSLACFQRYNIESIKLDSDYTNRVFERQEDTRFIKAVISLANNLGMKVVSQGVDTAAKLKFMHDAGCQLVQGEYFSGPVTAEKIEMLFTLQKPSKSSVISWDRQTG